MLVLSRKRNESIEVDGPATIKIIGQKGNTVIVGIEAERSVRIVRPEVLQPQPKP